MATPPLNPSSQKDQDRFNAIKRDGIHLSPKEAATLLDLLDTVEDGLIDVWNVLTQYEPTAFEKELERERDIERSGPTSSTKG
ncbi:MAG: hypothetical protein ACLQAH_05215 [Limisphaerales bacterium]